MNWTSYSNNDGCKHETRDGVNTKVQSKKVGWSVAVVVDGHKQATPNPKISIHLFNLFL